MDQSTLDILKNFGIKDPSTIPQGSVRLFGKEQLSLLGERSRRWIKNPFNRKALAYAIDSEHESPVGVALRNLHFGDKKDHLLIAKGEGPFWFNLHKSLPFMYESQVGVFVEGPKDALVLFSYHIPSAAFLGVVPTYHHLLVIKRYLRTMVWIKDNDPPSDFEEKRTYKVQKQAQDLGLSLIQLPIPAKDPADLVRFPEYFQVIRERVNELSLLNR